VNQPLDLSVVVRARLALEARRLAAVERMGKDGPSAHLVERLAGDRLRAIMESQRREFERADPTHVSFAKLAGLQRGTDRVSGEGLALAMGALARDAHLDEGACAQADAFVGWLAAKADRRFARKSVPGDEDEVHRSTDVIRRRVPDHGLWDLPVMAHEFGHLVAARLTTWDTRGDVIGTPVDEALRPLEGAARSRAVELFCDLFATYTVGPSFLCTQVFHRLDPTAPARTSDLASHPSDPSRVFAVQTVLKRMAGSGDPHGFDTQTYWARKAWEQMQSTASAEAVLTEEQQAAVRKDVAGWSALLTTHMSGFAYAWSPTIQHLAASVRSPDADVVPQGYSPADVLNAAWLVRLGDWFEGRPAPKDYERTLEALLASSLDAEVSHD
jgi:hypothetical protein